MNLSKIIAVAWNDLRISLFGNLTASALNLVIIPVVLIFIIGLVNGGFNDSGSSEIRIDVFDNDETVQSMQFLDTLRAINGNLILCPMDANTGDDPEDDRCNLGDDLDLSVERAQDRVNDGDTSAIIEIPAGFGEGVLTGESINIIYRSDEDTTQPSFLLQTVQATVGRIGGASMAAQVGVQVYSADFEFASSEDEATFRDSVYENATSYLANPPAVVGFSESAVDDDGNDVSGFAQSVPGMGSMYVMFTVLAGAVLVIQERQNWTLQRLVTMPVRRAELLGGKILGRFIIGMIQYTVAFLAGAVFGLSYTGIVFPIILLMVTFTLCITALTFLFGTLVSTEQQAAGMTTFIALTLAPLGGAWWPLEIVPDFMQIIGHISPVAWVMDGYNDLFFNNGGIGDIILPMAVLLVMAGVMFVLGITRFKYE